MDSAQVEVDVRDGDVQQGQHPAARLLGRLFDHQGGAPATAVRDQVGIAIDLRAYAGRIVGALDAQYFLDLVAHRQRILELQPHGRPELDAARTLVGDDSFADRVAAVRIRIEVEDVG